jgi:hypothetical protein
MDDATAVIKTILPSPCVSAKIFSRVVAKIFTDTLSSVVIKNFTDTFSSAEIRAGTLSHASGEVGSRRMDRTGAEIHSGAFSRAGAEIFFRSDNRGNQGRQINRPDHSGRRRASK